MSMRTPGEWQKAMEEKGHTPIFYKDGSLDEFVVNSGHHNGPGCSVCGWSCCQHCEDISDIPECTKVAPPPYVSPERLLIKELVEALEPFALAFETARTRYSKRYENHELGFANFDKMPDHWPMDGVNFDMGKFRRARAILLKAKEAGK